jgi:hypothetical protein
MTPQQIMKQAGMPQHAIDANLAGINQAIKKGYLIDSDSAKTKRAEAIAAYFKSTRISV